MSDTGQRPFGIGDVVRVARAVYGGGPADEPDAFYSRSDVHNFLRSGNEGIGATDPDSGRRSFSLFELVSLVALLPVATPLQFKPGDRASVHQWLTNLIEELADPSRSDREQCRWVMFYQRGRIGFGRMDALTAWPDADDVMPNTYLIDLKRHLNFARGVL